MLVCVSAIVSVSARDYVLVCDCGCWYVSMAVVCGYGICCWCVGWCECIGVWVWV